MRFSERCIGDPDFPGRYILDEPRFSGGKERIFNKEAMKHEAPEHHP